MQLEYKQTPCHFMSLVAPDDFSILCQFKRSSELSQCHELLICCHGVTDTAKTEQFCFPIGGNSYLSPLLKLPWQVFDEEFWLSDIGWVFYPFLSFCEGPKKQCGSVLKMKINSSNLKRVLFFV